jgi:hypothetical protein
MKLQEVINNVIRRPGSILTGEEVNINESITC